MRELVASIAVVVGVGLVAAAGFMVAPALGVLALGAGVAGLGVAELSS